MLVFKTLIEVQGHIFRNVLLTLNFLVNRCLTNICRFRWFNFFDKLPYIFKPNSHMFLSHCCVFKGNRIFMGPWWSTYYIIGLLRTSTLFLAGTSHARSAGITAQRFQCFVSEHTWFGGLRCLSSLWPPLQGPSLARLSACHEEKTQCWSIW